MSLQFKATITDVGCLATESLEDNKIILFNKSVPEDVGDYCFINDQGKDAGILSTQSTLLIAEKDFVVTAVGCAASQNLVNLGHITIKFDGLLVPEQPGTVHVIGDCPKILCLGDEIVFG